MRLIKRFLLEIGSEYLPSDIININNKRFLSSIILPLELPKPVYKGTYLGQNKQRFEPSSILLQKLAKESGTHKVYVDRDTAWLFVVGKDVFDENILDRTDGVCLGGYCLVMFGENCIGYGRYETSHDRRVVKNLFDLGDFLRREQE
jgi:ribosome biogenesis protein Nip4